tara:strand:- start:149 stop:529 length:381 start_codon:yes stop_codon:yes gene_type:complete
MGKWYGAISDFRKGQQLQKKPPLFKKLFQAGSVEEEALQLLLHEKRIIEQEKELQAMLNMRFGYGTWNELKEMRRKIRVQRDKEIYKQAERQAAFVEALQIGVALMVLIGCVGGLIYWALAQKGMI